MKKEVIFGAFTGDISAETAIEILREEGYPTIIFDPLKPEAEEVEEDNFLIVFFTPKKTKNNTPEKKRCLAGRKLIPASYLFIREKIANKTIFLIGCGSKLNKSCASDVVFLSEKYRSWLKERKNNSYFPWGEAPTKNNDKMALFQEWLEKVEELFLK